ncbi:type II toxin-antitoxin system HicA family toxin [Prevotellamassilia timonensis]|uniref:type II toxin-antitoxin system HicA family toxin n=1 Tax=Prevotellamassilia timonensis TaxID=1852370 RepID=UPI0008D9A98A|nr:type II toxin-antitoxin system HicA family toxin [Prevotellamassilia timonensis]
MGTKDKLIQRFKLQPKDFTWQELVRLFALLGFEVSNKGRTSGSRVIFENGDMAYMAHKPHPERFIKAYVMKQVMDFLQNNGLL